MQGSEPSIILSLTPSSIEERGRLLYCSKIIHPQTQKQITAEIFSKMIVMGSLYIPLTFDIRFCIK